MAFSVAVQILRLETSSSLRDLMNSFAFPPLPSLWENKLVKKINKKTRTIVARFNVTFLLSVFFFRWERWRRSTLARTIRWPDPDRPRRTARFRRCPYRNQFSYERRRKQTFTIITSLAL